MQDILCLVYTTQIESCHYKFSKFLKNLFRYARKSPCKLFYMCLPPTNGIVRKKCDKFVTGC